MAVPQAEALPWLGQAAAPAFFELGVEVKSVAGMLYLHLLSYFAHLHISFLFPACVFDFWARLLGAFIWFLGTELSGPRGGFDLAMFAGFELLTAARAMFSWVWRWAAAQIAIQTVYIQASLW